MPKEPITIDHLRDLIHRGEAKDPLVFLESIMGGQDPRRHSSVYNLIMEIDSFTNGELSKEDWTEIVDHVSTHYKYHTVSVNESFNAAKTLAEYLYPKRKQVELSGGIAQTNSTAGEPLTEEDIILFKEKFNDEF